MPYLMDAEPGVLLILIRHGKTELNSSSKPTVRGWKECDLSSEGRMDAQLTAEKLRPYDIQYIISSDFSRDTATANIIAQKLNISNIDVEYDCRTWDTGDYSGMPEEDVNPAIVEIYKRPWLSAPGGSESFLEFQQRWSNLLDAKMAQAAIQCYRPTAIVTHGRNLAYAQSYLEHVMPLDCYMPLPAGFATVSVMPDRRLKMEFQTPTEKIIADV